MGIVRKELPPPDVKEGEILTAAIKEIMYPIDSSYKDVQGKPKQQINLKMALESGYSFNAYIAYYESPSERSVLGALIQHAEKIVGKEYDTIENAILGIEKYGRLFVRVSGFREWNGKMYPKFKVVADRLPPKPGKQAALTSAPETPSTPKLSREVVMQKIEGWGEDDKKRYLQYLEDTGQLERLPS